jgi:phytol kinase
MCDYRRKNGFAGILAGIVCSLVERIESIDDNITVLAGGLLILLAAHYYFPSFTIPFIEFSNRF